MMMKPVMVWVQNMMYDVGLSYWYSSLLDEHSAYWDTHALDEQRHYNILCYAYGADPVVQHGFN